MLEPFWAIELTIGFKNDFLKLNDKDMWRVSGFLRNVVYANDPTEMYEITECADCPPSVVLFGLSDDGLGNKGIEIQVWINKKFNILHFLKCNKTTYKSD